MHKTILIVDIEVDSESQPVVEPKNFEADNYCASASVQARGSHGPESILTPHRQRYDTFGIQRKRSVAMRFSMVEKAGFCSRKAGKCSRCSGARKDLGEKGFQAFWKEMVGESA